jgi:exopolysaccharide production protein ExoQ
MQKSFIVSIPKVIEKVFVVILLLFLSGAIIVLLNESGENPISKVISVIVQLGISFPVIVWCKKIVGTAIREKLLWVFIAFVLVSSFWSALPATTIRSSILLVQITLFGVYLATRYSLKEQLQLLAWTFGIGALLSIVVTLVLPSYGVMGMGSTLNAQAIAHAGAWRGIYVHKNILGRIMALGALVFLIFATSSYRQRWVGWAGFGLSVSLIVLSTSKTALVVLLAIIALIPLYRALRWNYTIALPFFITVILLSSSASVLLVENAESIASTLGRDLTFTGRTHLWAAIIHKIQESPWLGYGYDVFWRAGWDGDAADVWSMVRHQAPHAHNGFLELALDTGLLGISVFVLCFLKACLQAIKYVRITNSSEGLFPIAFLTLLIMVNLTETTLLRIPVFWVIYVTVTLSMSKSMVFGDSVGSRKSNKAQRVNLTKRYQVKH